jgi:hypothetical protein
MGHKGPVLRPRCIGPVGARTQIPFIHSFNVMYIKCNWKNEIKFPHCIDIMHQLLSYALQNKSEKTEIKFSNQDQKKCPSARLKPLNTELNPICKSQLTELFCGVFKILRMVFEKKT